MPAPSQADLGDQPLKPLSIGGCGAGLAEIGIDHDNPLQGPAQSSRVLRDSQPQDMAKRAHR